MTEAPLRLFESERFPDTSFGDDVKATKTIGLSTDRKQIECQDKGSQRRSYEFRPAGRDSSLLGRVEYLPADDAMLQSCDI